MDTVFIEWNEAQATWAVRKYMRSFYVILLTVM